MAGCQDEGCGAVGLGVGVGGGIVEIGRGGGGEGEGGSGRGCLEGRVWVFRLGRGEQRGKIGSRVCCDGKVRACRASVVAL